MPEDEMAEAILSAHRLHPRTVRPAAELFDKVGKQRSDFVPPPDDGLYDRSQEPFYDGFRTAKQTEGKHARADAVSAQGAGDGRVIPDPTAEGASAADSFSKPGTTWKRTRRSRPDPRRHAARRPRLQDLRHIDMRGRRAAARARLGLFQRGETQALITVTLGTGRDEQRVDGLVEEYTKKFMLDYNFPSFSVGECRPIRGPGRREIGHGALAERSVNPVLPDHEEFPYTIRVISRHSGIERFELDGDASAARRWV